ncbi:MAG TPA: hypothetical protein VKY31_05555 [Terriglobia bacterium]|jgi:hypothetical protein|nr:hypothetical protein [Terriglobia bacterium]
MTKILCLFLVSGALSLAQDHPNFSGDWKLDTAKSQASETKAMELAIKQDGDDISITGQQDGKSLEFKCATTGQNCKRKGEAGEVSMYYNGPVLIELDMDGHNGDHVVKKRLQLADGGKSMEMDVMRISPPGPSEKLVFAKSEPQQVSAAAAK